MKQYKIGDKVWYAQFDSARVEKLCPVCYGKKEVILILGNDERVKLPCDYCGHGINKPSGYVHDYELTAKAEPITITSLESRVDKVSQEIRYYSGGRFYPIEDLFDTKKEALARCEVKKQEHELEETTRASGLKKVHYKSYTWNAGYHLHQAESHANAPTSVVICGSCADDLRQEDDAEIMAAQAKAEYEAQMAAGREAYEEEMQDTQRDTAEGYRYV